jgi:dTDP-glucose pyrophosphorylase
MRREDASAALDPRQAEVASSGLKTMIPDALGRPFLDHVISSLADSGVTRVVLVVAPDAEPIRGYYRTNPTRRVQLNFAVQAEATGTARALLAAESLVTNESFVVLNADNLYPVAAIRALVTLGEPGLIAFERDGLVQQGNFDQDRVASFAILKVGQSGMLEALIEKPDPATMQREDSGLVSMNLWRFDARIFDCCRDVQISSRGEYELPQAVGLGVQRGIGFRAVRVHAGVLDLSSRGDIAQVAARLSAATPLP